MTKKEEFEKAVLRLLTEFSKEDLADSFIKEGIDIPRDELIKKFTRLEKESKS